MKHIAVKRIAYGLFAITLLLMTACERKSGQHEVETLAGNNAVRHYDPAQLALGAQVFKDHCAQCHGAHGEGAPNWRKTNTDGTYPPPPLNGSGHEWHHPKAWLKDMVRNGSPQGQGKMPAWGGKLSDAEIDAVVAYFQSLWPDEVYAAWYDMEQRSLGR